MGGTGSLCAIYWEVIGRLCAGYHEVIEGVIGLCLRQVLAKVSYNMQARNGCWEPFRNLAVALQNLSKLTHNLIQVSRAYLGVFRGYLVVFRNFGVLGCIWEY